VANTYARAHKLAEQIDESDYIISLTYGQAVFHNMRADRKPVLSLANRLERFGEVRNDLAAMLLGRYMRGNSHLWLGDFVAARALFEQCQGLADPALRSFYVASIGVDIYLAMLSEFGSFTLTCLGYIDQGRARVNEALLAARQLGHAYTLGYALFHATIVEWLGHAPLAQRRLAEELIHLSSEHGFEWWLAWATYSRGVSLVALEEVKEGFTAQIQARSMLREAGSVVGGAVLLATHAEACAKLGRPSDGLNALTEATRFIEATNERFYEAEVHRLRGDLVNATGDRAGAERSYDQALEVARRQKTRLWELRAATSLARLWRDEDRRAEAHALLAPIYGWFTQGFAMPDLRDAKALLDELG
jgi:tetratricopeptide (TPR) repeat protein